MNDVKIILGNGNLGRAAANLDGVCALIGSGVSVSEKFALGDILALRSLADAENFGITEEYDGSNVSLLWHHIRAFYDNAGEGVELYVLPVANTVTMEDMVDKSLTHAPRMLDMLKGRVRMLAISRVPDEDYGMGDIDEFDSDVWAAAAKAQELYLDQFDRHRPIHIFIEGRAFQGNPSGSKDLRSPNTGLNANRVSIVIGADRAVAQEFNDAMYYAAVTIAMGRAAAIGVQRNIGRVKDGPLTVRSTVGLSDGRDLDDFTVTQLETLNELGYIFMMQRDGKSGYYFNNDHCACPLDDDYAYIHRSRPIDKAARIIRETYIDELLDDVMLDEASGKLAPSVIKHFQRTAEKAIEINMLANEEISGVSVFVDPDQDVLATDKIKTVMRIVPKGMVNSIEVTLSYSNPLSA